MPLVPTGPQTFALTVTTSAVQWRVISSQVARKCRQVREDCRVSY